MRSVAIAGIVGGCIPLIPQIIEFADAVSYVMQNHPK